MNDSDEKVTEVTSDEDFLEYVITEWVRSKYCEHSFGESDSCKRCGKSWPEVSSLKQERSEGRRRLDEVIGNASPIRLMSGLKNMEAR